MEAQSGPDGIGSRGQRLVSNGTASSGSVGLIPPRSLTSAMQHSTPINAT
jgi:hypothetical protein